MGSPNNPLADGAATDRQDQELVRHAQEGRREALEQLIARHQAWIYSIALRMLYTPQDAEDTTQEILIKLITKLSTFEGRSSFRTWPYRMVVNHLLNVKRRTWEEEGLNFVQYGAQLDAVPDLDLADPNALAADTQLILDEARIGCTSGMLLCLDREQWLICTLGEIFGVTDLVGAELLEISRENFRQKLTRARRDLHAFMQDNSSVSGSTGLRRGVAIAHQPAGLQIDIGAGLMRHILRYTACVLVVTAACARGPVDLQPDTIIGLERAAPDRWGKGDPDGYLNTMAPDVTYFDPTTDARVDRKERLKTTLDAIRGKISVERAELVNPTVVGQGDVGILTFNLISHGGQFAGGPKIDARWNCTEVYRRIDGAWKIIHSHWSFTKPEVKVPAGP